MVIRRAHPWADHLAVLKDSQMVSQRAGQRVHRKADWLAEPKADLRGVPMASLLVDLWAVQWVW